MRLHLGKLIASSALCLLLASCAQTGPPLPPSLELPKPVSDLHASRKGDRVTLTWSEPTLTTDRQSVRYIGPTLVCRSLDPEITTCGNPVATLPAPPPLPRQHKSAKATHKNTDAQKGRLPPLTPQTYLDTLPTNLQQENANAEVTYAVEILNPNARSAGLSNRVHVPAVVPCLPDGFHSATLGRWRRSQLDQHRRTALCSFDRTSLSYLSDRGQLWRREALVTPAPPTKAPATKVPTKT